MYLPLIPRTLRFLRTFTSLTVLSSLLLASIPLSLLSLPKTASADITTGLVGHWKFDGNATDSSGQGNNGTLQNGPTFTTGQIGQGINLDGTDDSVSLGTLDVSGSALTLSAWFKADSFTNCSSTDCRLISKATGVNEGDHYWMVSTINSSGTKLRFRLKTGGTTHTLIANTGTLSTNTWTHMTAVYNGSTMKLYKDGVEVGSTAKTGTLTTNSSVQAWIGDNPPTQGSRPFDGIIDDVRIYNRALSTSDITELYQGTAPSVSLTASPTAISTGNSSTLSWTTANVTSCTASGAWSGTKATSGSQSVTSSTNGTYTYTLSCTGTEGTATDSATITVSAPDTTPPSTPQNLAATAQSSSQINLSWTASTDNVGVTGYRLERCQGSSCSNFSQIATPTNNSYTDTGLTAETTYRYRVRATDGAGNLSSYSSVVSGVTQSAPAYLHGEFIGPHNTGWRGLGLSESDLKPHNGIFTEPGVYEGLDIQGQIQIRANNVTIRGFRVLGTGNYAIQYYPTWSSGYSGAVLEYGEVIGDTVVDGNSGAIGVLLHGGATTRRLHIRHFRVGMHLYGNDITENNYIEDLVYSDGSHNTSLSIRGSNVTLRGSHLTDGNSAALSIYPNSPIHNVDLIDNFWQTPNAHYCVNFGITGSKAGASESDHIRVINNIWGQDHSLVCGRGGTHFNWTNDRPGNEWKNNRMADGSQLGENYPAGSSDTTPPTISLTSPANGATVSNTTTISATSSDNVGVSGVQFKLGGVNFGNEDTTSPYSISWNTTGTTNGTHTITATARDVAGNTTTSSSRTVTVSNTTPTPTATITANPATITQGNTTTLTWSSTNATSCTGTNFSTANQTTGSTTLTPSTTTTYTVTCTGSGGTATNSVTVTVTPASTKFSLNDRIYVNVGTGSSLNIRSTPNGTLLGTQPHNALGTVIGGPQTANSMTWWNINFDSGVDGWGVQDYLAEYTDPASSGLIAAYDFEAGSGTTLIDRTGNGFHGILVNSPTWMSGHTGGGLSFNGFDNYVTLPGSLDDTAADFTFSAWIHWQGSVGYERIFDFGTANHGSDTGAYLFLTPKNGSTDRYRLSVSNAGYTNTQNIDASVALPTNQWVHIAVTLSGDTATLYRNGNIDGTGTITLDPKDLSTTNLYLARSGFEGDPYFTGTLDDVRIYNKALTQTEIQNDMNTPVGGSTSSDTTSPSTPTNLSATAQSSSQIALSWNASTDNVGVSGYRLERCQGSSCSNFSQIATPSGTTYTDTGLTAETTYRYRVRATDGAGNLSSYSSVVSGMTQQLSSTKFSLNDRIYVNVGTGSSLNIRSTPNGTLLGTQPHNALGTVIGGPQTANSMTWWNINFDSGVDGWGAEDYLEAYVAPPSASITASLTSITVGDSTTLTWSSTNATSCTGTNFSTGGVTSGSVNVTPTSNTTYTVSCTGAGGTDTDSVTITVNPAADTTPPSTPTNLSATAVSSTQINLSWTASTDNTAVTGYHIYRNSSPLTTITSTTYSDTSLTPNTSYTYTVVATDAAGNLSDQSTPASDTTLPDSTPTATPCQKITSSTPLSSIPQGFGVPYNVFSPTQDLLVQTDCNTDTANSTFTVGDGTQNVYIWPESWYYKGGGGNTNSWQPITLTGAQMTGGWIVGEATATLSSVNFNRTNSVLTYMCVWNGTAWKCGCRTSACDQGATPPTGGLWQLQQFGN